MIIGSEIKPIDENPTFPGDIWFYDSDIIFIIISGMHDRFMNYATLAFNLRSMNTNLEFTCRYFDDTIFAYDSAP